jgi:hypothetical protein
MKLLSTCNGDYSGVAWSSFMDFSGQSDNVYLCEDSCNPYFYAGRSGEVPVRRPLSQVTKDAIIPD